MAEKGTVFVYGGNGEARSAAASLEERGFTVVKSSHPPFSDADVVLSHEGHTYIGERAVERAVVRIKGEG